MDSEWFAEATKNSVMGTAARELPWDLSPLGRPVGWPPLLRSAVRLCFSTRFPVMIAWGPELTMIYNDGYRDMLGTDKRLTAMGQSARVVWEEVWDDIGPLFDQVMTTGEPTWTVDAPLLMNRSGFDEETAFTFSYSPLKDPGGTVCGVLDIATETTAQVVDRRRLSMLDSLHVAVQDHRGDVAELVQTICDILEGCPDVGRSSVFLVEDGELVLAGGDGLALLVSGDLVEKAFRTRKAVSSSPMLVAPLARPHDSAAVGVIVLEGNRHRPFDAGQRSFLMVVAAAVGSALSSTVAQLREIDLVNAYAELAARDAHRVREASLTLQQSLLTPPPVSARLDIVVRYRPAAEDLEIGGDWYDAFHLADGATVVAIGDVTGHDHHAAAAMGQIRGLVRAIAFDGGQSPAQVLERTDRAILGLALGSFATATTVLAQAVPTPADDDQHLVRWSNAGHPAPVVIRADGTVEDLRRPNDLILGVVPDWSRTDHETMLGAGDTLFLYTDGLVERRGTPIATTTGLLLDALVGAQDEDLDTVCDRVIAALVPDRAEDDLAVVTVRVKTTV